MGNKCSVNDSNIAKCGNGDGYRTLWLYDCTSTAANQYGLQIWNEALAVPAYEEYAFQRTTRETLGKGGMCNDDLYELSVGIVKMPSTVNATRWFKVQRQTGETPKNVECNVTVGNWNRDVGPGWYFLDPPIVRFWDSSQRKVTPAETALTVMCTEDDSSEPSKGDDA